MVSYNNFRNFEDSLEIYFCCISKDVQVKQREHLKSTLCLINEVEKSVLS